jgi:HSP20 family protein
MSTALKPRFALAIPQPFAQMERDMDQLLGHFFGNGNGHHSQPAGLYAPANLWEEEGKWCVELELPGVKQENLDITLEKNTLRVAAERPAPEGDYKYWHQERGYGRIERVFQLPETVDAEGIEAELADGVLKLTLAKKPEAQPRKIEIRAMQK